LKPFFRDGKADSTSAFGVVKPNASTVYELKEDNSTFYVSIPSELDNKNAIIEIIGSGKSQTEELYSNSLVCHIYENYGQIKVMGKTDDNGQLTALRRAYVKVYCETESGETKFFKDGYTDLRGKFDYASVSSDLLTKTKRFAILIVSQKHGSVVRTAQKPPS
jgi:hypothetical protein